MMGVYTIARIETEAQRIWKWPPQISPSFHCAGLLLWGGLAHIRAAYASLQKAIQEAGLAPTGESEEWTYYFEGVDSPHNLMALYIGVKEKA
jgi:hypothetical protein